MKLLCLVIAASILSACAAPYKTVHTCGGDYKLKANRSGPLTGNEGKP